LLTNLGNYNVVSNLIFYKEAQLDTHLEMCTTIFKNLMLFT